MEEMVCVGLEYSLNRYIIPFTTSNKLFEPNKPNFSVDTKYVNSC